LIVPWNNSTGNRGSDTRKSIAPYRTTLGLMLRSARVQCDVVRSAGWDDIDDNHVKVGLVDQRSPHLGTCPRQSEMKPWPETVSAVAKPRCAAEEHVDGVVVRRERHDNPLVIEIAPVELSVGPSFVDRGVLLRSFLVLPYIGRGNMV
jgi:hypothetical protein